MARTFVPCLLAASLLFGSALAAWAADPDFTVVPSVPTLDLSEPGLDVLRFTITNMLDMSLTVGGYQPKVAFAGGDFDDDFGHVVLGPITPYVIAANGSQVVPVLLYTDLEFDDPSDLVGGHWSFTLFPQVFLGKNPQGGVGGLVLANGHNKSAEIVVHDVPEPSSLALTLGGLVSLAWSTRRRRPQH